MATLFVAMRCPRAPDMATNNVAMPPNAVNYGGSQ